MRLLFAFAAFALALSGATAASAEPLSPAAFRDRLAASISSSTGVPAKPVDDRTFTKKDAEGSEVTISIDNAYAEYLSDPEQLDTILKRFERVFGTKQPVARLDQLTVIVRPSDYVAESLGSATAHDKAPAGRPLAGDLSVFLAIDSPETIRTVVFDDLKAWNLSEAQAWEAALASVKARIGPVGFARMKNEPAASVIVAESGLAPSILGDPVLCGPASPTGLKGAVVLLLARDALLVGFPDDKDSMRAFWKVTREQIGKDQSLSKTAITCRNGRWTPVPISQ